MELQIRDEVLDTIRHAQALDASGDRQAAIRAYGQLLDQLEGDGYQRAAVNHMYALIVDDPHDKLAINEQSLREAESVPNDGFPYPLRATLLANIGWSHLILGDRTQARHWYEQAEDAATGLGDTDYGNMIRSSVAAQLRGLRDDHQEPPGITLT